MLDLNHKIGGWAIVATTAVVFFGVVTLAPLVASASVFKQAGSLVSAALSSFAIYKMVSWLIFLAFRKSQRLRKFLLGDAFIEGTWVGHYQHNNLNRFTIEIISQAEGETRITGREFDENGKTRADWSSESSFIDLRRQRLTYVYSCDVYQTNHQQNGIGSFKLIKSDPNNPPDTLDGYAVDMIDGTKDPNTEHKISDLVVKTEDALAKAKEIFGV